MVSDDHSQALEPFIQSETSIVVKSQPILDLQDKTSSLPVVHRKDNLKWNLPKRYIFSIMGLVVCSLSVNFNTNISIAIVSMVNRTSVITRSSNECVPELSLDNDIYKHPKLQLGDFSWSPETEGLVIGAAYYGQLLGFIPGGRLAELYGGKRVLLGSTFLASVFTLLCPFAAYWSIEAFIACRFLIGIGTAPAVPVLLYLIAKWIPASERSFHASFILAGYGIGSFAGFIIAGELCGSDFLSGWPAVFYVGGAAGCIWCFLCYFVIYESPKGHPGISKRELTYILKDMPVKSSKKIQKIPWKSMVLSIPLWSLALGTFGQFWILGFFCTSHALYMGTVLNLDIVLNGQLSCLPHITRALFAIICSYPADYAMKRKWIGAGFIRKGATLSNTVVTCAGFVGILLAGCDPVLNTALFVVASLLGDFVTFGVCMACIDIAPDLSGTIGGLMNIIGVIPYFIIPSVVGSVTMHERTMKQWSYVFYITIGVALGTTIIYVLFGTSEAQPWGVSSDEKLSNIKNAVIHDTGAEKSCSDRQNKEAGAPSNKSAV